jgi:hypothetical protein
LARRAIAAARPPMPDPTMATRSGDESIGTPEYELSTM